MKQFKVFRWVALSALLVSCSPVNYFQMFKTAPDSQVAKTGNNLVYEDDQCKVSYNLWSNGGDAGFVFQNKTNQNIYVDLGESFFILNGMAHNYFRNRVYTTSSSSSVGNSAGFLYSGAVSAQSGDVAAAAGKATSRNAAVTASRGFSVSHAEDRIVCIPPHAAKRIAEYSINNQLIRNCDLFRYPMSKQISTSKYTKANSPLVFSNQIVYSMGEKGVATKLNHEFYVTEITNYPHKLFFGKRTEEFCGEKSLYQTDYFLYAAPENFYIQYSKNPNDNFKH